MTATLDPQVRQLLEAAEQAGIPEMNELPVAEARQQFLISRPLVAGAVTPLNSVIDRTISGPGSAIPIRVYRASDASNLPVLVYFHGGGWVIGNLDSHDDICRNICRQTGYVVVAVDYRLAPEHKFPAAVEDAWAATQWVAENAVELGVDGRRLAVGGDSAGGNLAAVVCQLAQAQAGLAIKYQLLIYPVTDATLSFPSMTEFATGYRLTKAAMQWFVDLYANDGSDAHDARMSPLWAVDLAGLPPALIITAGFDPLRDEGKAYADKLQKAGVEVDYCCYDGMVHGFMGMAGVLDKAQQAQQYASEKLAQALQ